MRRLGPWNSMRRPWWTMRSTIAAASLSSAKMVPHLPDPDVGGEDDAAAFVCSGDDLVEQAGAVDVEGHVAEFIEDDQIGAGQVLEDLIETAGAFGLAQLQDEFGGLAEAHGASLPDGFDAQGDGQVGLASSGASVEDEVLGVVEELEAGELVPDVAVG